MKTQTESEAEAEAATPTECGLCPIRCGGPSTAAARTLCPAHAPLYGHGNASISVSVSESKWGVTRGAPRTHRCTSTSTSMAIVLEASLARINFRPTRSLSPISVSARVCPALGCSGLAWSGLPSVCTWILLGSGSRASAGHVHVRFLWPTGNWR